MRKKISFVVLTNSGSPAKQFCTSRAALRWAAGAAALMLCLCSYVAFDYVQLKRRSLQLQQRESELAELADGQRSEIDLQRQQIGDFAREVNDLKEKLLKRQRGHDNFRATLLLSGMRTRILGK